MYEEFVAAFAGEGEEKKGKEKGPKAFVRGGTIQPGSSAPGALLGEGLGQQDGPVLRA